MQGASSVDCFSGPAHVHCGSSATRIPALSSAADQQYLPLIAIRLSRTFGALQQQRALSCPTPPSARTSMTDGLAAQRAPVVGLHSESLFHAAAPRPGDHPSQAEQGTADAAQLALLARLLELQHQQQAAAANGGAQPQDASAPAIKADPGDNANGNAPATGLTDYDAQAAQLAALGAMDANSQLLLQHLAMNAAAAQLAGFKPEPGMQMHPQLLAAMAAMANGHAAAAAAQMNGGAPLEAGEAVAAAPADASEAGAEAAVAAPGHGSADKPPLPPRHFESAHPLLTISPLTSLASSLADGDTAAAAQLAAAALTHPIAIKSQPPFAPGSAPAGAQPSSLPAAPVLHRPTASLATLQAGSLPCHPTMPWLGSGYSSAADSPLGSSPSSTGVPTCFSVAGRVPHVVRAGAV